VLCAWLVAGIAAFVTLGHPPPLPSYFVLVSPFLAILASTGVRVLGARVWMTDQTARVAEPHADQRLAEGGFDAVVLLRTDLRLAPLAGGVYRQRLDLDDDFVLLWDPVRSRAAP
jgi:hypothetical protein